MSALHFDKAQIGNLEYSLQREMLSTNRAGGYMSTTIVCCNTRKYHGLMVCPVRSLGDEEFVLLSSLDETIVQHGQSFNLALHRFEGNYEPRGHKYITDFQYTPCPTITYRVGGVVLKKEMLWVHSAEQLLIRYTLLEAHSQTFLRLRPFLAFRNRHELSHANMVADGKSYPIQGGVRSKLYNNLPWLNMQLSRSAPFVAVPDWYMNFEYALEGQRGYPSHEDLLTTGYFELELKSGQSVVFSASTTPAAQDGLEWLFDEELARRTEKTEFLPALRHSARQFLINYKGDTSLQTGYPWYNPRSRETFIALAGCTLTQDLVDRCAEILDHHKQRLHDGLFGTHLAADTQLWFFHTLSEFEKRTCARDVWRDYGSAMKEILNTYRNGDTPESCIRMTDNGLIYAYKHNYALTWMNARVDGTPITQRAGYAVEINALWYNAVCYAISVAQKAGDKKFVEQWKDMPELIKKSFNETFWDDEHEYLADYVREDYSNFDIRPNQLFAISLAYSPLNDERKGYVLNTVRDHLLTTRGVRTLSPRNVAYKGRTEGNQQQRDMATHQGTAFPWLLEHYVRASFSTQGAAFLLEATDLLNNFKEDILNYGIGSVPEIYDGDPPHNPGGTISYAPSVGAMLMINEMIDKYKNI
ncbi:MAG: amylo-alpha-1,6-glucosidase [Mucinivorans sp.]